MNSGFDSSSIGDWLGNAKTLLDIVKGTVGLVPSGPKRDELEASIARAEDALARSDAALAKQLGFQLCQCSFPPKIMLWREGDGAFVCPDDACGRALRPARAAPARKEIPAGRACPLCDGEMKVEKERPHPDFDFAGVKVHHMTCTECGNKTERVFRPGKGYS